MQEDLPVEVHRTVQEAGHLEMGELMAESLSQAKRSYMSYCRLM